MTPRNANESSSTTDHTRRLLAAYCLIGLGILFATNPLSQVLNGVDAKPSPGAIALNGFLTPLHMLLMIGSVIAITHLLRTTADRRALIGGALTLMGWTVSVRILAVMQLARVIERGVDGVPADAIGRIFNAAPIVFVSMIPVGLMFPIGVVTLGLTLFFAGPLNRWTGALLAAGGVFFPIGRAAGQPWAWLACDLSLGVAFALIGWQVLSRPELWHSGRAAAGRESLLPAAYAEAAS